MRFDELGLKPELLDGLDFLGFEACTPIQAEAIPHSLEKKDIIGCAQTGTGKTGAYLIPAIQRLMEEPSDYSRVLIIVPTRELASQIDQNVDAISYFTGVSSISILGGNNPKAWERQKYAIQNGTDILITTPGRFLSHLSLGYINLDHIEIVVLDEADKMLDMGFHADILRIISHVPEKRQTLMYSATMAPEIRKLAKKILTEPVEINLNLAKPAEGVDQSAYIVYDEQKIPLLAHLLSTKEVESMIVFASSKASVDEITRKLKRLNHGVNAIHSDKDQEERQETLRAFKNRQFPILVGTDVLARGIDIDNLSHVLNYDCPIDAEDYVHRVGRTARAERTGEAITFVNPKDQRRLQKIERLIESEIPKALVPEELGPVPTYNPRPSHGGKKHGGRRNNNGRSNNHRNRKGRNNPQGKSRPNRENTPQGAKEGNSPSGSNQGKPRKKRYRPRRKSSNSSSPENRDGGGGGGN